MGSTSQRRLWWQLLPQWTWPTEPTQSSLVWHPTTIHWRNPNDTFQQWGGYPIHPGRHIACAATKSAVFQRDKTVGKPKCVFHLQIQRQRLAHKCNMPPQEDGPHGWIHPVKLHGVWAGQSPVLLQRGAQNNVPANLMVKGGGSSAIKLIKMCYCFLYTIVPHPFSGSCLTYGV